MMYYYWKKKGIRPSVFYNMPKGEQKVVQAFFEMEIDEELEFRKNVEGKLFCPYMLRG